MKRKECPKCEQTLPLSKYGKRRDGRPTSYCKECQRRLSKQHYQENKKKYNQRRRVLQKEQQKNIRQVRDILKSEPCTDCGKKHPTWAMDFDHRDPSKKSFTIGRAATTAISYKKFMKEIEKCDLVCALCHRYRTYGTEEQIRSRQKNK